MQYPYKDILNGEKTVLDGSGAELDMFITESHPCLYCGRPVYSKSKYCNNVCKAAYHRKRRKEEKEKRIKLELERFRFFIEHNPKVYSEIKRQALEFLLSGAERISIKYIVENVRRDLKVEIDNIFTPLFARRLAHWNSRIGERLEIRRSKFDKYLEVGK